MQMSNLEPRKNKPQNGSQIMDGVEGFRALFEYATEGIIVSNSKGVIVRANPSAERLFGYNSGELIGQAIEALIPQKYAKHHVGVRSEYMQHPKSRSMGVGMELFAKRKDNSEFQVEISLSPYNSAEGRFVIAFIIDITVRKQQSDILKKTNSDLQYFSEKLRTANLELEKRVEDRTLMLREAVHELEKSQKEIVEALAKEKELNDLKSRFVSMASHEFRTPLSTILSSVALISKYKTPETEEKRQKHIDRVKSSVTHLTEILNDLLSLSKLEEGKLTTTPVEFDIVDFSKEIVQDMQALAKEGQVIGYTHSGDMSNAKLDVKLLKNIYINLLSNAIKFSPENKQILVNTAIANNELIVSFKDSGIGIEKEDQKLLFDRFFRGQNATNIQGTGLGLNIVSKYVEMMNGTISFESEVGKGTTFFIKFPLI